MAKMIESVVIGETGAMIILVVVFIVDVIFIIQVMTGVAGL